VFESRTTIHVTMSEADKRREDAERGGGLGSSTIFKKINEPYAPS